MAASWRPTWTTLVSSCHLELRGETLSPKEKNCFVLHLGGICVINRLTFFLILFLYAFYLCCAVNIFMADIYLLYSLQATTDSLKFSVF